MPRGILGDHGKALWRELAPLLAKAGLLTELDRPALTMTCLAWQHAIDANALLGKGLLLKSARTDREIVKNPAWSIFVASMAAWRQWANEFGLTPAARASIEVTTLESEGMTLAELLFASVGESPSEDGG
jgi:P27 family predicted phage terminase small subunit